MELHLPVKTAMNISVWVSTHTVSSHQQLFQHMPLCRQLVRASVHSGLKDFHIAGTYAHTSKDLTPDRGMTSTPTPTPANMRCSVKEFDNKNTTQQTNILYHFDLE